VGKVYRVDVEVSPLPKDRDGAGALGKAFTAVLATCAPERRFETYVVKIYSDLAKIRQVQAAFPQL
jgi:hypothetical protein